MSSSGPTRRALVLAFDERFAIGAETSLFSLLRHNPWFDAQVLVIGDGLGAKTRAGLRRLYPVEFLELDPALESAARRLARTGRVAKPSCVYALQAFSVSGVERLVFMDVDTLCLGDVRALFESEADFSAAPDLVQLEHELEARSDSAGAGPTHPRGVLPYGRTLAYSFNSGVFSVSTRWLSAKVYGELLQFPGLTELSNAAHALADQYVLNRYFDGEVTPLDPRYNFLVPAEALLRRSHGLALSDVRILHFAGYSKPWELDAEHAQRCIPRQFLRYYECWYELREMLTGGVTERQALERYRHGIRELSAARPLSRTRAL